MRIPLIILSVVLIFIAIQLFRAIGWAVLADEDVIRITLTTVFLAIFILVLIGFVVGAIWPLAGTESTDADFKVVGGGVVGLSFFSGLCFGGSCIPAAFLGGAYSVIFLLPIILGLWAASFFSFKPLKQFFRRIQDD